jgi:predicted amidohydrolase YtcJ
VTLLRNARVFGNPGADSVLVDDGRIAAVGRDLDGAPAIDLHGSLLTPGLNDAHLHLMRGASLRIEVDLRDTRSPAEMQERIAERAAVTPAGQWITGRGWDHTLWPDQPWPTRALLDQVSAVHPMYFSRVDIHVAVANSAALQIAGASGQFPDGLLRETEMAIVRRMIPAHSKDQRRAALLATLQDFARLGITSCQDNSTWDDFLLYRELEQEGKWTLRVSEWLDFLAPVAELEDKRRTAAAWQSPLLRTGLAKGFSDGSLGSCTAALLAPYSDDATTTGILRLEPVEARERVRALDAAGFQIGLHAIGDAAVRLCLDAFAGTDTRGKRHRIEHAQIVADEDLPRFAQLGLIASVQPCHWLTDRRWAGERLGPRLLTAYRWSSFARQGVPLAIGTDFPVEPPDPAANFAALTGGREAERLTRDEALAAYTAGSAYAEFADHEKGRIAPGQLADLVAWDSSPSYSVDHVLMTMLGGDIIFSSGQL